MMPDGNSDLQKAMVNTRYCKHVGEYEKTCFHPFKKIFKFDY